MTGLYYTLGVLLFVLAILLSIALHELGHLVPAKRFGAKVTQYFVGFGPTVWSRRRGETEYGLKAIPLGGYVKILGMLPPSAAAAREVSSPVPRLAGGSRAGATAGPGHTGSDHAGSGHAGSDHAGSGAPPEQAGQSVRVRRSNTGMFAQLISDARAAEWELVRPEDTHRLFYRLPWWKKAIVMSGGPLVNVGIAFVVFLGVFATYGNLGDARFTPVVSEVSACVVPFDESERECTPDDPVAPAYAAGLRPGDRIIGFNGTKVTGWNQLTDLIRGNADGRAEVTFVRDGQELTVVTSTTVTVRPASVGDDRLVQVGFLGVLPTTELGSGGVLYTLDQMGSMTWTTVKALGTLPVKVWHVALAIAGLEERDTKDPVVSIVGGGRLAGETAAHDEFDVQEKAVLLLMMIAGFNLFIGMFNFVPLLPLDGGHIAGALWEGLRRGLARLRGRPDPGYVDVAKLLPVAYVVAGLLLVMGVVLIVGDLVVPIHLA